MERAFLVLYLRVGQRVGLQIAQREDILVGLWVGGNVGSFVIGQEVAHRGKTFRVHLRGGKAQGFELGPRIWVFTAKNSLNKIHTLQKFKLTAKILTIQKNQPNQTDPTLISDFFT